MINLLKNNENVINNQFEYKYISFLVKYHFL